jgi:hypothetical protein
MSVALSDHEIKGLYDALDDEYRAWATYEQVIQDFGAVRPFINIRDAEARHIQALVSLFSRYGLQVPVNPWVGKTPRYRSLEEACKAGVEAEIENASLYERVLATTQRPDIINVYRALQEASQERHLPAFQRHANGQSANNDYHASQHGYLSQDTTRGQQRCARSGQGLGGQGFGRGHGKGRCR